MMEGWKKDKLGNLLELVYGKSLPKTKRAEGNIPVYGSNGIVGFHNEATVNESGIIVGRKGSAGNIHFSNVPFCPIDTTFYITQQHSKLELYFLYYALYFLDLKSILGDVGVPGLNREMAYLEELFFPIDKAEQRKIAQVLSTVQKAIEQQDKLIRTTTELKKALMQKLFTEGTRGEPQKETEIGLVPGSWGIVELGKHSQIRTSFPTFNKLAAKYESVKQGTEFFFLKVSDMNLEGNEIFIYESNNKFLNDKPADFTNGFIKPNSLIFPKRGAAISTNKKRITTKYSVLDPNLIGVEPNSNIDAKFLYNFFEMFDLSGLQDNNVIPQLNKHNVAGVKFPLPSIEEQRTIATDIEIIENKIKIIEKKKQTLTALFKTLLHELMTGQRRVHEMEFKSRVKDIIQDV